MAYVSSSPCSTPSASTASFSLRGRDQTQATERTDACAFRSTDLYFSVPQIFGGMTVPAGKSFRQPLNDPSAMTPRVNAMWMMTVATSVPQTVASPSYGQSTFRR